MNNSTMVRLCIVFVAFIAWAKLDVSYGFTVSGIHFDDFHLSGHSSEGGAPAVDRAALRAERKAAADQQLNRLEAERAVGQLEAISRDLSEALRNGRRIVPEMAEQLRLARDSTGCRDIEDLCAIREEASLCWDTGCAVVSDRGQASTPGLVSALQADPVVMPEARSRFPRITELELQRGASRADAAERSSRLGQLRTDPQRNQAAIANEKNKIAEDAKRVAHDNKCIRSYVGSGFIPGQGANSRAVSNCPPAQ